ncbi:MAG: DUF4136 domain-containing protein [Opitutaceae bacterium]
MRLFFAPVLASTLLFLTGCVSSPTTVDYDRAAASKFGSYKCFIVDSRETRSHHQDVVLSPIVDRRIETALGSELQRKGFTQNCGKHDFRVTFNTVTKTVTDVNDMNFGTSPFRRYPHWGHRGYSHIEIDQYEQGTFLVDIIDEKSKQLVWRGAYTKRLGWSAPNEAEVQKIISEILAEFPPTPATAKE